MRKKSILILLSFIIGILVLVLFLVFSSPKLNSSKIRQMNLSIQSKGAIQFDLTEEEKNELCTRLNTMEKKFRGITAGGKGWTVWISCSNGGDISIVNHTITYHGIVDRKYRASEEDISELVEWLRSLEK